MVEQLKLKFDGNLTINIILGNFFDLDNEYDLIIEQTFFCALDPDKREAYVDKMKLLLAPNGKIAGLLFNKIFDQQGPPFGGNKEIYLLLFYNHFHLQVFELCYNSFVKRQGSELFIIFKKRTNSFNNTVTHR